MTVHQSPLRPDDAHIRGVLAAFKQRAPVDVVGAAKELGIAVYSQSLPDGVSGILRRDAKLGGLSGFVILVDKAHPSNRQRFTVAHEIGHFALHRSQAEREGGIRDDEFYRALSGPLETEANQFAADLLMPWLLIKSLQDAGVTEPAALAERLRVSKQAMTYRLGLPYDQNWT